MSMPTTSLAPRTAAYTPKPPVLQHRSSTRLPATCWLSHFAVLALVGEEAGLVRAGRIGAELDAVFGDDGRLGALGVA